MNYLRKIGLLTLCIGIVACGNHNGDDIELDGGSGQCASILEQGLIYVFTRGWQVDPLRELTVEFVSQDIASAVHVANLEVTKVRHLLYQLSFPVDTNLQAVTNFTSFLQSQRSIQAADDRTMVVALFRVESVDVSGQYGIVAGYTPQGMLDTGVFEIIANDGTTYHHYVDQQDGSYVTGRSTPEVVQEFLDEWEFENCN